MWNTVESTDKKQRLLTSSRVGKRLKFVFLLFLWCGEQWEHAYSRQKLGCARFCWPLIFNARYGEDNGSILCVGCEIFDSLYGAEETGEQNKSWRNCQLPTCKNSSDLWTTGGGEFHALAQILFDGVTKWKILSSLLYDMYTNMWQTKFYRGCVNICFEC